MVSCGAKHTLMLDSEGNIWFWGKKSSVGIEDIEHEYQKTPKLLLSADEEGPFMHISTKHEKNLALTSNNGVIFSFGSNKDPKDKLLEPEIARYSGCKFNVIKPDINIITSLYAC